MAKDYAAVATQYADDVVNSRIPACKWVRLACQRHLNDQVRAAAGWAYQFNPELTDLKSGKVYRPADRVCKFAELMHHTKGDWAARGERIRLEPWQVFILASIFGWIVTATGKRRFRIADIFVPRKNGKSALAAIIGLFMLSGPFSGMSSKTNAMSISSSD